MSAITITVVSRQVTLTDGVGTVAVSVTNTDTASQRLILGAYPPEAGASPGAPTAERWTSIERPLRDVAPGATEQYLATFAAGSAAPGTYQMKFIAYSADQAPEDYGAQGQTITVTVPAAAAPAPPGHKPWRWIIAAASVVVVIVVGAVVLTTATGTATATGTGAGAATNVTLTVEPADVQVPNVTGSGVLRADAILTASGLSLQFAPTSECDTNLPVSANAADALVAADVADANNRAVQAAAQAAAVAALALDEPNRAAAQAAAQAAFATVCVVADQQPGSGTAVAPGTPIVVTTKRP
jgi:hypothetical protein